MKDPVPHGAMERLGLHIADGEQNRADTFRNQRELDDAVDEVASIAERDAGAALLDQHLVVEPGLSSPERLKHEAGADDESETAGLDQGEHHDFAEQVPFVLCVEHGQTGAGHGGNRGEQRIDQGNAFAGFGGERHRQQNSADDARPEQTQGEKLGVTTRIMRLRSRARGRQLDDLLLTRPSPDERVARSASFLH